MRNLTIRQLWQGHNHTSFKFETEDGLSFEVSGLSVDHCVANMTAEQQNAVEVLGAMLAPPAVAINPAQPKLHD